MDSDDDYISDIDDLDYLEDINLDLTDVLHKVPNEVPNKKSFNEFTKEATVKHLCELKGITKVKAELFLELLYITIVTAIRKKMNIDPNKKLYSNKKKLVNSNIRNFLYNCIRTNNEEPEKDLFEEDFVIRELAPEDYATQKEQQEEDLSKCFECGSIDVQPDPIMQTLTCRNCGVVRQTRATGVTFSHLASYVDKTNYVKTSSGKKIYVKGVDDTINRLYKKLEKYFEHDEGKLGDVIQRVDGLGYRNVSREKLYDRIVRLIISMYPDEYYKTLESLTNLLKCFNLVGKTDEYKKYATQQNFRNLFHKYKGEIDDKYQSKLSLDTPMVTFATYLWLSSKNDKGREASAALFGLNPQHLTNEKERLELERKPKSWGGKRR